MLYLKNSVNRAIFFLSSFITLTNAADSTDISRLRADILRNYDPVIRPVKNNEDTTIVETHFLVNGMSFDEKKGVMTLYLLTVLSWEDQHVKWDPMNYGNLSEIPFAAHELWKPDLHLINNYDWSDIDHFGSTLMIATSEAEIWWLPPTTFQAQCPTDYRLWPYDKQTCMFEVASWSYYDAEMNLTIPDNITTLLIEDDTWLKHHTPNREWDISSSLVERHSVSIYCCPPVEYVSILITVDIARRSSAHTAAVTIVGQGLAVAILLSFWLNPFANERIPLNLLVMILNVLYLQFMYRVIPNNGASVPLAICFFRDSLIMVTFAFTWTVAIRYVAKTKRSSTVPLPDSIQNFLSGFGATILCLNPRPQSKTESQKKSVESSGEDGDVSGLVREGEDADLIQQDWEWLARLLDRLAFFGYFITYIVFISAFL